MQNSLDIDSNSTPQNVCESFKFSRPELWSEWIAQFEQYLLTTNLNLKSDKEKIEFLCDTMGSPAKLILLEIIPDYVKGISYEKIKTEFSKYFMVKKHVIIERHKFHNRTKQPNETIDSFISDLLKVVGKCDYGPLENRKLRERIFLGIGHNKTSELTQATPNSLTLEDLTLDDLTSKRKEENVPKEWHPKLLNRRFYRPLPYNLPNKDYQGKNCGNYRNNQTVEESDTISDLNKQAEKLCIKYND